MKCIANKCWKGAAVCEEHSPSAGPELKKWLEKYRIKTTVTPAILLPQCPDPEVAGNMAAETALEIFAASERKKLQKGEVSKNMSDPQLLEYFREIARKSEDIVPVPKGEVLFLFCVVKGKTRDLLAFIDGGCNTMLAIEGVPENELDSALLRKGPIYVGVAGGGVTSCLGIWGCLLPLADGSKQVVRTLTMKKVTMDMPMVDMEPILQSVKEQSAGIKAMKNIRVPKTVGGQVDLLIGLKYQRVFPEPVHSLPNGLTVFKSKFLPGTPGVLGCIGGPVEALEYMSEVAGSNMAALVRLQDLATMIKDSAPRIDYFPDCQSYLPLKGNEGCAATHRLASGGSASVEVSQCGTAMNEESDVDPDDTTNSCLSGDLDPMMTCVECEDCMECSVGRAMVDVLCNPCVIVERRGSLLAEIEATGMFTISEIALTSEQDLKRFMEYQQAGLERGFRCPKCRDCPTCKKGPGYEKISMRQEAEQEVIKDSIYLDRELKRGVARLAFIADPKKLISN